MSQSHKPLILEEKKQTPSYAQPVMTEIKAAGVQVALSPCALSQNEFAYIARMEREEDASETECVAMIYDIANQTHLAPIRINRPDGIWSIAATKEGDLLIGGLLNIYKQHPDSKIPQVIEKIAAVPCMPVRHMKMLKGNKLAYETTLTGLMLKDMEKDAKITLSKHTIKTMNRLNDDTLIVLSSHVPKCATYNVNTGKKTELDISADLIAVISENCIAYANKTKRNKTVTLFEMATNIKTKLALANPIQDLIVTSDSKLLCAQAGKIEVFDLLDGNKKLPDIDLPGIQTMKLFFNEINFHVMCIYDGAIKDINFGIQERYCKAGLESVLSRDTSGIVLSYLFKPALPDRKSSDASTTLTKRV